MAENFTGAKNVAWGEQDRSEADSGTRTRLNQLAPAGGGGSLPDLASSPAQKKAAGQGRSRRAESGRGSRHAAPAQGAAQPAAPGATPSTDEASNGHKHSKKGRRGEGAGEDRYSRMAREAEAYSHTHPHSHVVEEARVAVEEASPRCV